MSAAYEVGFRAIANGEAIFGPSIARRLPGFFTATRPSVAPRIFPELTECEGEIVALIAQGRSNEEIALDPRYILGA